MRPVRERAREIKWLAETIDTWWPENDAFLRLGVTNARTEGSNRTIKQVNRVACGMPNQANYERHILAYANKERGVTGQNVTDHLEPRRAVKRVQCPLCVSREI